MWAVADRRPKGCRAMVWGCTGEDFSRQQLDAGIGVNPPASRQTDAS